MISTPSPQPAIDPICGLPIPPLDLQDTESRRRQVLATLAALNDDETRFVRAEVKT